MRNSIKVLLGLLAAAPLFSCDRISQTWQQQQQQQDLLATVENKKLYMADMKDRFPPNITKTDSLAILHSYVDMWVKQALLLHLAEENLSSKQKDVSSLLEDYRASLLVYRYEQEYVERVDTAVSESECESFYNKNRQHFILSKPIARVLFIKLRKNSPYLERIKKIYTSSKPEDATTLEDLCLQAALKFDHYGDRWLTLDELAKELPARKGGYEDVAAKKRVIEVEDGAYAYLVSIRDFKERDAIAPIEHEYGNIKAMILNRRKDSMIQSLEQRVLQEAKQKSAVKIYLEKTERSN
ncbi:MAG: hypothetical protein LBK18_04760 [Prevotellaceae bacterium]|jgi:hypothetical protein|nr:hypothetical protein [Prevotellaceae bacterium]